MGALAGAGGAGRAGTLAGGVEEAGLGLEARARGEAANQAQAQVQVQAGAAGQGRAGQARPTRELDWTGLALALASIGYSRQSLRSQRAAALHHRRPAPSESGCSQ